MKWLNQKDEDYIDKADKILEDTRNGNVELLAPELAKYEIGNVLLKTKQLTHSQAQIPLGTVNSLPVTFVAESEDMAQETFTQAYSYGMTYYDAAFVSLAKKFNATLVTDNTKHQGKSKEIKILSLKNY